MKNGIILQFHLTTRLKIQLYFIKKIKLQAPVSSNAFLWGGYSGSEMPEFLLEQVLIIFLNLYV
ncbi:hypothetical protein LEP1GSC062_3298 [Leptospira alexanderi serovar Manhao 3 str. L 60]|uniref:Uncharacterized protein n=1 Tax=Leptospira alexanderi serovar Manhao 3 str. L 60 TaxID=1049759 RepID=V6I7M7_9LEPT|nr:hypothetical protein LEP1GSC062_3298 [Leptospira alexanderi serovar Manhao 3 str. L 60]